MKGTTKFFLSRRGYGFITGEDGKDYFVYHSSIQMEGFRTLRKGQVVTFDVETKDGKESAVNVILVKD